MESLDSLHAQLRDAQNELRKIIVTSYGDVPWNVGVTDQHNSTSYSYEKSIDQSEERALRNKIAYLEEQIRTYTARVREEREKEKAAIVNQIPKYNYTVDGKEETTNNPAIAARYDAQQRLFGMTKVKQALATLSGQKRKFKKLWIKAATTNEKSQEEIAYELNKIFR